MTKVQPAGGEFTVTPLGPDTWDDFAALAERHNGVWGGCWCTWFHTMNEEKTRNADDNRALKERLVDERRAHAALVFDGDLAVAWCQYGAPEELPNIKHRKAYEAGSTCAIWSPNGTTTDSAPSAIAFRQCSFSP